MGFLCANFIAPVRISCIVGGLAIFATLISSPAFAQDRMHDDRMRDDHRGGMGGGAVRSGVGVGLGILSTLPQESGAAKAGSTTSKTTTKKKKQAKKPDDDSKKKKQAKKPEDTPPQRVPGNPPQTPPATPPTTDGGPPQTPPATPPTTAGGPPQTPGSGGGSPPGPPGPPSTTDNPPTTAGSPPTGSPSGGTGNTTGGGTTAGGATTPVTHRPLTGKDCPQRGKGCAILILDYSKVVSSETNMENLVKPFETICGASNVQYVAPNFVPVPNVDDVNKATLKAVMDYNKQQQAAVNTAIAAHRALVSKGVELAVEVVNGHGLESPSCGSVGSDIKQDAGESRTPFHLGNYKAAFDNTCTWLVADFSCYSGRTPQAADELNNFGTASCAVALGANTCPMHAAYENDIAYGTASAKKECYDSSVISDIAGDKGNIGDALNAEVARHPAGNPTTPAADLQQLVTELQQRTRWVWDWGSKYIDRGYKYCTREKPSGYP